MTTTIIKLKPLPNPIRATTKNYNFLLIRRFSLTLCLIRAIHVWGKRLKFCGAGINAFIGWGNFNLAATLFHILFFNSSYSRNGGITKSIAL